MKYDRSYKYISYTLSFIIPVLIAVFAYFQQGIYPGGPNNILIYDLRGESLSLYGYLSHFGPGYDNLFHWMSGGLGGGFIGSAAMYLSFFDLIFFFVPVSFIPTAIYFLLLLKIGLCGLFFSIFIFRFFEDKKLSFAVVLLSCCYALMSYVMTYSILLIWLDGVMMLPLLALFAEKICEGKKSIKFVICLSLMIIDDYYIAFMISVALIFYIIFRLVEKNTDIKSIIRRFFSFAVHGLLAAGLSSIILFPVVFDLFRGKLSENIGISDGLIFKNNVIEIFKMLLPSNYVNLGSNQPPYIYCGSVVIVMSFIWLLFSKGHIKARLTALAIIVLYFASFAIGPLDRLWHGFRDPIGFSCRYSFTFVFFLICFAARGISLINRCEVKKTGSIRKLIPVIAVIYTVLELGMNSSYLFSRLMEDYVYSNSEEYKMVCDVMESSLGFVDDDPSKYGRLIKNFNYSCNDGALFGYDGLDMFTSSYNSSLITFLRSLGINSSVNFIKEPGFTPPLANILNVRYFLSYWYNVSDYYTLLNVDGSFGIFRNENSMPFAYCVSDMEGESIYPLTGDPFENINTVYSDIFGSDMNTSVFEECVYDPVSNPDDAYTSVAITPALSGHYWIYPEYVNYSTDSDGSDYMPSDLSYLTCYVDGSPVGDCGFYNFRYCCDLGYLEAGNVYTIAFDAPCSTVGSIHIAYYDHELCSKLISNVKGLELKEIGSKGIYLSGTLDEASDVLITMPYDNGYRVYVNGEKVKPESYRHALMRLHLNDGYNEIEINYYPKGLSAGIVLSVIFIVLSVVFFYSRNNEFKEDK